MPFFLYITRKALNGHANVILNIIIGILLHLIKCLRL